MAQMPMYKGRRRVVGLKLSPYHLTTISLPRQRLFFERFAFGYSRSVVWLEPFSCLAIAERLKGCF
ncbi:MAG: hypothetical protein J6I37_06335 [Prevotella sp.]|nr:hypothetical protein [Prevotella sp.]